MCDPIERGSKLSDPLLLSTVSKWSSHFASVSRLCWRHDDNDSGDDNNTLFYSRARNNDQAACKSLCCVTRNSLFSQRRGSGWGSRQFHLSSPKPQPMPRGYGLDQRVSGFATTRLLGRSLLFASLPLSPCTSNCKPSSLRITPKMSKKKETAVKSSPTSTPGAGIFSKGKDLLKRMFCCGVDKEVRRACE